MTMAIPPDQKVALFAAVASRVEPKDNNEDLEEALKTYQKESDEQLKQDLDAGLLTWEKLKPAAQYAGFVEETLHEDNALVLDPTYWTMRKLGYAQPLLAEVLYEQREQSKKAYELQVQQATMMGMMAPPAPDFGPEVPKLWPLLLHCRSFVVERIAAEYRRLDREHSKREGVPNAP